MNVFYYAGIVFILPFFTVRLARDAVGGLGPYVGFGAALTCMAIAVFLAQTSSLVMALLRVVRKIAGSPPDGPPTMAEKSLLAAAPMGLSIFVYAATGAMLLLFAHADSTSFLTAMLAIGAVYGALSTWGMLSRLD